MTEKDSQSEEHSSKEVKYENSLFCYQLRLTEVYNVPDNWTPEAWQIIEEHGDFLNRLGKEGILVFAGRTIYQPGDKRLFGIALIKAKNLEAATKIMENDPAVIAGIQQAMLYPFSMGIRYFDNIK